MYVYGYQNRLKLNIEIILKWDKHLMEIDVTSVLLEKIKCLVVSYHLKYCAKCFITAVHLLLLRASGVTFGGFSILCIAQKKITRGIFK